MIDERTQIKLFYECMRQTIIKSMRDANLTRSDLANLTSTDRRFISKILNRNSAGISMKTMSKLTNVFGPKFLIMFAKDIERMLKRLDNFGNKAGENE